MPDTEPVKLSFEQREENYIKNMANFRKDLLTNAKKVFRDSRSRNMPVAGANWLDLALEDAFVFVLGETETLCNFNQIGHEMMKEKSEVLFKAAQEKNKKQIAEKKKEIVEKEKK